MNLWEQSGKPAPEAAPRKGMKLRPYQDEAVAGVLEQFEACNSTLICMPTGTGKTVVFAELARLMNKGRVLVVAHRQELVDQAEAKLKAICREAVCVEMADRRARRVSNLSRIVVTSVQTQRHRKEDFDPFEFGLVVIDEAHHAPASSYMSLLSHYRQNPDCKVLGVTATPDRADEVALGKVFQTVAYDYQIPDAIRDGWLVPIRCKPVLVRSIDLRRVGTVAGDLNQGQLDAQMKLEKSLYGVCRPVLDLCGDETTLIFAVSLEHAGRMCEILNTKKPDSARFLHGKTPTDERRQIVEDYALGRFQYLVNVGVATEGFDNPRIQHVAIARPTKSRALYCLDDQTEILCRDGWHGISDDIGSAEVASFDTATGGISYAAPEGVVRRPVSDDECFVRYDSPHMDIRVTDRHRMVCRRIVGRGKVRVPFEIVEAASLCGQPGAVEIPVAGECNHGGVELTDDEIRFIGWVVTDGSINKANGAVTIAQSDHQPWLEEIPAMLEGCGFKYGRHISERETQFKESSTIVHFTVSRGSPRGRGRHLRGWGALERYIDKDLSPALEDMTRDQFKVLLEAMHLGDGAKQIGQTWTRRSYHISTANRVMADRLQKMCVTRGHWCNVAVHGYNKRPLYVLHIKDRAVRYVANWKDRPWFHRQPARPGEMVWCVQTKDGTIITRRNGKVAIVGNCQMVGRGTRPLPGLVDRHDEAVDRQISIAESSKPHLDVLDFVGNSGKHKLISVADILGESYDDEIIAAAQKIVNRSKEPKDVAEALKEAVRERKERLEKLKEEHDRIKARRSIVRRQYKEKVEYTVRENNPFDLLDLSPQVDRGWNRGRKPTEKMVGFLERAGIPRPEELPFGQAMQLIGKIKQRWAEQKATFKQVKLLNKFGVDAKDMSMTDATKAIDRIAANGWRKPS